MQLATSTPDSTPAKACTSPKTHIRASRQKGRRRVATRSLLTRSPHQGCIASSSRAASGSIVFISEDPYGPHIRAFLAVMGRAPRMENIYCTRATILFDIEIHLAWRQIRDVRRRSQ